jgi:hypothetical protein
MDEARQCLSSGEGDDADDSDREGCAKRRECRRSACR